MRIHYEYYIYPCVMQKLYFELNEKNERFCPTKIPNWPHGYATRSRNTKKQIIALYK